MVCEAGYQHESINKEITDRDVSLWRTADMNSGFRISETCRIRRVVDEIDRMLETLGEARPAAREVWKVVVGVASTWFSSQPLGFANIVGNGDILVLSVVRGRRRRGFS